jgi:hypothetical protein
MPSLAEVEAWDVTHLENASRDWTATAEHWESAFTSIHRASVSPGGTLWEGAAAEAAQERAFADLVKVRGLADVLHQSAAIARRGAETLYSVKRSVLDAVEEIGSAGYLVGQDLSVTPTRAGVAAETQAQLYATDIQGRVAQLVACDKEIAGKVTAATASLNEVSFLEAPDPAPPPRSKNDHIQAVDHTWAQNPPPGPNDGPTGDDIRRVVDKLPEGERPSIREVRSPEDLQNLWNWARQHGEEIPNGYGDPSKGTRYRLPDGTLIGQRWAAESNGKPVLDIDVPGHGGYTKVHINPRGGAPELPTPAAPRPIEPPAPSPAPRPVEPPASRPAPPRPGSGGFGGGGIGGGGGAGIPGLGIGGLHTPTEEAE